MTKETNPVQANRSPKAERAEAQAETSVVLDRALTAHGTNVAALALTLGVSATRIGEWRAPEQDRHLSVADASRLPPLVRLVIAEHVAGPGYVVAELPAADAHVSDDLALAARTQRETAEAVAKHLTAIADGRYDRAEGVELEREVNEAIAALLTVRETARRAIREGVVGANVTPLRRAQ